PAVKGLGRCSAHIQEPATKPALGKLRLDAHGSREHQRYEHDGDRIHSRPPGESRSTAHDPSLRDTRARWVAILLQVHSFRRRDNGDQEMRHLSPIVIGAAFVTLIAAFSLRLS